MNPPARSAIALGLGCLVLAGLGAGDDPQEPRAVDEAKVAERGPLEGTWEQTFQDAPPYRQVKLINKSHFMWATYDRDTGVLLASAGGTYTFDGETYKEKVEFGSPGIPAELIGEEQTFTVDLDGKTWKHEGTMSNGLQVRETWRRVQ